jgi:hypothetical protein
LHNAEQESAKKIINVKLLRNAKSCMISFFFQKKKRNIQTFISMKKSSPQNQTSKPNSSSHRQRTRPDHRTSIASVRPAARPVVGDIVPLGGDFEDGAWAGVAAVVVVHQQEIGRGAVVVCF